MNSRSDKETEFDILLEHYRQAVAAVARGARQDRSWNQDARATRESLAFAALVAGVAELREKAAAWDRINTPELHEFTAAVENEALHQRARWPGEHDAGKTDADWFWLIGYLAGKALHNPPKSDMVERDARLHRIITVAAAAANWHAAVLGTHTEMRPGVGLAG